MMIIYPDSGGFPGKMICKCGFFNGFSWLFYIVLLVDRIASPKIDPYGCIGLGTSEIDQMCMRLNLL